MEGRHKLDEHIRGGLMLHIPREVSVLCHELYLVSHVLLPHGRRSKVQACDIHDAGIYASMLDPHFEQNPTTHSESSPLLRVAYFFKLHNSFKAFKFNRQTTMTPRIKNVELCLVNVCDVCRLIGIIEKDKPVWEFLVERYKRI
ncbi:hypothetical protein PV326_006356 [Microctonus aethiopoides]|nr:hypothetical protein PV326_006356 [Microctonus aethiopoides]